MKKRHKFLFLGCGFLATHLIANVIPHAEEIILVDRERIESVNYDNSIYLKNQGNKRKVTSVATYLQLLTNVTVVPHHENLKNEDDLLKIKESFHPDIAICTFDNLEARALITMFHNDLDCPILYIGVTENFIYIDWDKLVLPYVGTEWNAVKEEMKRVRDVCTRLEFRPLGLFASAFAYKSIVEWMNSGKKMGWMVSVKEKVEAVRLER